VIWERLDYPQGFAIQQKVRQGCEPIGRVLPYLELPHLRNKCDFLLASYLPNGDFGRYTITEILVSEKAPCFAFTLIHELAHLIYECEIESDENEWFEAIQATDAYAALVRLLPDEGDEYGVSIFDVEIGMVEYLLNKSELFARAFSQYIAYSAENEAMIQAIDSLLRPKVGEFYYAYQWESDDFGPVSAALDRLFTQKKWK
jgi:hypothetical protein